MALIDFNNNLKLVRELLEEKLKEYPEIKGEAILAAYHPNIRILLSLYYKDEIYSHQHVISQQEIYYAKDCTGLINQVIQKGIDELIHFGTTGKDQSAKPYDVKYPFAGTPVKPKKSRTELKKMSDLYNYDYEAENYLRSKGEELGYAEVKETVKKDMLAAQEKLYQVLKEKIKKDVLQEAKSELKVLKGDVNKTGDGGITGIKIDGILYPVKS